MNLIKRWIIFSTKFRNSGNHNYEKGYAGRHADI